MPSRIIVSVGVGRPWQVSPTKTHVAGFNPGTRTLTAVLATKCMGIRTPAYEICLISVGDGCHAVPDNRIGGCWETMAGFPYKNFLMQGRVQNPPVRSRSQIVARFNPIRLAQGQV